MFTSIGTPDDPSETFHFQVLHIMLELLPIRNTFLFNLFHEEILPHAESGSLGVTGQQHVVK